MLGHTYKHFVSLQTTQDFRRRAHRADALSSRDYDYINVQQYLYF